MLILAANLVLAILPTLIQGPDAERVQLNKWFDSLGITQLKEAPFVKIEYRLNGRVISDAGYGFLTRPGKESFAALGSDLIPRVYVRRQRNGPAGYEVAYSSADLKKWLADRLSSSKQAASFPQFNSEPRAEWFVLARLSDLRGFPDFSDRFFQLSRDARFMNASQNGPSYSDSVKDGLAHKLVRAAMEELGNLEFSREEVDRDLHRITDKFPPSPWQQTATEYAKVLDAMVAEDRSRKPLSDQQLRFLSPSAQASELVWQLRNQTATLFMLPGSPRVLNGSDGPAKKLAALGLAAVPALLDAFHDARYMRAVRMEARIFNGDGHPMPISDAALQLLEHLAYRQFYGAHAEEEARAWWADIQRVGERKVLIEATRTGQSTQQPMRLAEAYPEDAPQAISEGLRSCSEDWGRANMLHALGRVKGERALQIARDYMLHDRYAGARLAAAEVVCKTHPDEAVAAMCSEWKNGRSLDVAMFLSESNRLAAMNALKEELPQCDTWTKLRILENLWLVRSQPIFAYTFRDSPPVGPSERACVDRAVESLFAEELLDAESAKNGSAGVGEITFNNPRVCDVSAACLSKLWPSKYAYRYEPSEASRDWQRIAILNVWRRTYNMPPIPLPPARTRLAEPNGLDLLLNQVASGAPEERQNALDRIETLGVAALPAVMRLAGSEHASPLRDQLDGLAVRLSCFVRSVTLKNEPADSPLVERLKGLKGTRLTTETYVDLVKGIADRWPAYLRSFRLVVDRDDDGMGIDLTFEFNPTDGPESGTGMVTYANQVSLGNRSLVGNSGATSPDMFVASDFDYVKVAVETCLSSKPLVTFSIRQAVARPLP